MRSAKVMANAFRAGFQRMPQRVWPVPLGSRDLTVRYKVFSAACSFGKCPRALTALRKRALSDSIAFVEHRTLRISVVVQERHELGPGVLPEPDQARPHFSANSSNARSASAAVAAW